MAEKDKDNLMIPDEITDDLSIDTTDIFDDSATFKIDKGLGIAAGMKSGKPINNKAIDDYLSKIEKPTGGSVYDKMAARYRSQGEGTVLRTQKNLTNLFSPTINLIQEREAAAQARFTLLKDKMPEFDDSTIFGAQSGNEMPIVDEIKKVSASVKEDLRMLSRLNPADERYDEIKKRVQKNQDSIVNFDKINKQLLKMRNAGTDESQWSKGMDETTANMWRDIYTSNGKNIKVVDGKLIWTDTKGTKSKEILNKSEALNNIESTTVDPKSMSEKQIEKVQKNLIELGFELPNFGADGKWGDETQAAYDDYLKDKESIKSQIESAETTGVGETKTINLNEIGDGPINIDSKATNMDRVIQGEVQKFIEMNGKVDDPMYSTMIKSKLFELNKIGPQGVKSLIFDGIGTDDDDLFTGMNTDSFIEGVIRNHYGEDLSESEIERHIDMMRSGDVTQMYKDESGKQTTLQSQFMKWYKGEIDKKITEGRKSKVVAASTGSDVGGGGSGSSKTTSGNFKKDFSDLATKLTDLAQTTTATSSTKGLISDETVNIKLPSFSREGVVYTSATLMIDPLNYGRRNAYKIKFTDNSQVVDLPDEVIAESLAGIYGVSKEEVNGFFKKVNQEYMDKSKDPRDDLMEQEFSNAGWVKEGFFEAIGPLADNLTSSFRNALVNNTINDKDLKDILESIDDVEVDLYTGKVTGLKPMTWQKASQLNAELEKRGI